MVADQVAIAKILMIQQNVLKSVVEGGQPVSIALFSLSFALDTQTDFAFIINSATTVGYHVTVPPKWIHDPNPDKVRVSNLFIISHARTRSAHAHTQTDRALSSHCRKSSDGLNLNAIF